MGGAAAKTGITGVVTILTGESVYFAVFALRTQNEATTGIMIIADSVDTLAALASGRPRACFTG